MKVSAVIVDAKIVAAMEVTEVTAMKAEFSHFQPSVFEGCLARGLLFPRLGLLLFGDAPHKRRFQEIEDARKDAKSGVLQHKTCL